MLEPDGPVEVWLSQRNMQVYGRVVHEDETTSDLMVDALSIRGAQREMTGWMLQEGYKPVGRWEVEQAGELAGPVEVMRRFVPVKGGDAIETP